MFQGDDSKVLLVIDQPITELLEHAGAPPGLTEFARTQYGGEMTLMDLEPSIVISAIDAVRYRSVTQINIFSHSLTLFFVPPRVVQQNKGIQMPSFCRSNIFQNHFRFLAHLSRRLKR